MYTQDEVGDLVWLVASGVVDLNKMKVHTFPLGKINEAVVMASTPKGLEVALEVCVNLINDITWYKVT